MGKKTLWASTLALILVFTFFEYTDVDLLIQQYFYLPAEKSWILKDPTSIYRKILYTGIKIPIYIIGVSSLIASIYLWKKKIRNEYRKGLLIITLTLIILPTAVATAGKSISNVQCPYDLDCFNGTIPYVKTIEPYPINPNSPDGKWPRGKCWPAGHASGGFALFSLVCFFRKRRQKVAAFILAMSMGWTMGIYQMLRGAHFISHHLVTMLLALILVSALNVYIKDFDHESSPIKK